ncbi:MAG: hypothetical protein IPG03_12855 [Candidatus Microthrix sp.]|nr:hypothetical protein [Candidatus Microthrix sp.]MBK6503209.1 hypothetical protein [Candidatus Microthrix sp.]
MSTATGLGLAACGAAGMALLVDPLLGGPVSRTVRFDSAKLRDSARMRLDQAGLTEVSVGQLLGMSLGAGIGALVVGLAVMGAAVPSLMLAAIGTVTPVGLIRRRRRHQLEEAREAWPAMIEEIRLLCSSVGRSIPRRCSRWVGVHRRNSDRLSRRPTASGCSPATSRSPPNCCGINWRIPPQTPPARPC